MANIKISEMPEATDLSETDIVPIVGGAIRKLQ